MARTLEQKIAALDAKIASLRQQNRKLETGQKIILGGMLLNAARHDSRILEWILREVSLSVTRAIDKDRLAPLLTELQHEHAQNLTKNPGYVKKFTI